MCFFITTGMGLPSFSLYTKESFWGCDSKFKFAGLLGPMIFEWFPPSGRWAHLRPWELQNWRSHFARGTKFPLTAQGRGEVVKISKRPIPREFWFWIVVFLFEFEKWEAELFQSKVENGKLGVGQGVPATWSPFTPEAVWSQEGNESFLRDATHWPFCFWAWDSHLVFVDSFLLQKQFNSIWGHKLWILITFAKVKELKIWEAVVKAGLWKNTGRLPQKIRPSFWGNESRCQSDGVLWWQTLGECHRRFGTWDLAACCWGLEWYSLRLDRVCCVSLVSFDGIGFCGFMKGIRIPPLLLFVSGFPFAEVGCFSKWPSVDQNSCSVSDARRTGRKTRDGFWNLGCPRCMLDFGQFSHTSSVERREVLGAHTSRGKVGWGLVVNRSHLFGSCLCSFGCRCVHCPFYFHCWRAF